MSLRSRIWIQFNTSAKAFWGLLWAWSYHTAGHKELDVALMGLFFLLEVCSFVHPSIHHSLTPPSPSVIIIMHPCFVHLRYLSGAHRRSSGGPTLISQGL